MIRKNTKLSNYASILLPLLLILLIRADYYYYGQLSFRLFLESVAILAGMAYVILRASKGAKMPSTGLWPLAIAVYAFLVVSVFMSGNPYAGIPRLVMYLGMGLFFLLLWDGFDVFLNHRVVLTGVAVAAFFFMVLAFGDVAQNYQGWWQSFGLLGEKPPFVYRIQNPIHSNHLTALLNLLLPIVLIGIIKAKSGIERAGWILWLGSYGAIFIYASSRSGIVGAAAGIFGSLALMLLRSGLIARFQKLSIQKKIALVTAIVLGTLVIGYLGLNIFLGVSSHPTHGGTAGEINLNRGAIWAGYWNIVQKNSFFGAGVGRQLLEFFAANGHVPPKWLPIHAHSLPLGLLAELGFVGGGLVLILIAWAAVRLLLAVIRMEGENYWLASGVLAGLFSFAAHAVFDDYLYRPIIFFFVLMMIAWLVTYISPGIRRCRKLRIEWALPVLLVVLALVQWAAYPQRFVGMAYQEIQAENPDWEFAAELAERALEIAPNSHLYLTQSAYFWYQDWFETGDRTALQRAQEYFDESLQIEPGLSWIWANKALVSWYLGEELSALSEIKQAIALAPEEPVYHLNLGWIFEERGDTEKAVNGYMDTLELAESYGWYLHPYWEQTAIRQQVLEAWQQEGEPIDPTLNLDLFYDAYSTEEFLAAKEAYQKTRWVKGLDTVPDILFMDGYLALSEGNKTSAIRYFEQAYEYSYSPIRLMPLGFWEARVYGVQGWGKTFIPGVLQLAAEFGQFDRFDELVADLVTAGIPKGELCDLYISHERAIAGGEVFIDQEKLPLVCQ